jgi:hypothetical protein
MEERTYKEERTYTEQRTCIEDGHSEEYGRREIVRETNRQTDKQTETRKDKVNSVEDKKGRTYNNDVKKNTL